MILIKRCVPVAKLILPRRHAVAVYSSQSTRAANRKAIKPQPTRQAKLVAWHLTFRVPPNFAAIPESNIKQACDFLPRYWRRWIVVADAALLQKDQIPRV
jgi:hypothetical protein